MARWKAAHPDVTVGGAVVVLGLVSSKTPVLESQDDLRRRIDEAARYVPLENLALVVDTAEKVWG